MTKSVELRDFEAFVAVAETRSFTAAARLLRLTQPSVSARIASLEASMDARLLDRMPSGARITPAGAVLLPRARAILRDREEAVKAVQGFQGRIEGTVRVGASTIPGTFLLPRILPRLRAEHPGLRVQLTVDDSDRTLDALRRGDVELAIVGRAVHERGLVAANIGEDEIVLVASPAILERAPRSRRRGPALLERIPLVLREQGSGTRTTALRALEAAGVDVGKLDVVLEVGGNAAVLESALAGVGAAIISRLVVAEHLAAGTLQVLPVFDPPLIRPFFLATDGARALSPGARELARSLGLRRGPTTAAPAHLSESAAGRAGAARSRRSRSARGGSRASPSRA